jgi:hypothetical protein
MRYMMLVYSKQRPNGLTPEQAQTIMDGHKTTIEAASQNGILIAAEPLAPTTMATTVRMENGSPLILDGPFAETKEQLAGYYILDCKDLDEAIEWAARIPTGCKGDEGCIEIRPLPGIGKIVEVHLGSAAVQNV